MKRLISVSCLSLLLTLIAIPVSNAGGTSTSKIGKSNSFGNSNSFGSSSSNSGTVKPYGGFGSGAPTQSQMNTCAKTAASMYKCATGR